MRSQGNALLCVAFTLGLLEAYFVRAETKCGHFSCGTCAADGDRCRACREGYTFDDARTCVPCSDPLCAQCGPPGACTACKEQAPADTVPTAVPETNAWDPSTIPVYMDRLGTCRKCKAVGPCLECNSEGRCTRCPEYSLQPFHMIPAFMLTKAGCVMCRGVNCVRCDPSAPDRCLKCQGAADPDPDSAFVPFPTYVDPKTGSCKECTKHPVLSGCAECSGSDSGQACQKCLPGYMLRGGQCLRCRDPLCKVCTGAKADRCLKCKAVESDSSGPKAVFMGADGMCRKYNGTACIKAASAVRCLECEPANCMQYSESGSLYCYHRNMLDPSTGRCISCEALTGDPHCDVCTLQGACLRCRSDTGWMPAGPDGKRRCAPCVDKRCEVCQADHRVCESCSEWEVLDFDNVQQIYRDPAGRCQPCKAPCFTCAPNGSCRSCIDDWRPDPARPGKCVACAKGAGCISCFSPLCDVCGTDGTCARCKRNPDVGPTCRPCKAVRYCAECDAAGACVRCNALDEPDAPASFGLDDSGQCRTCQDPKCTSCTTDFRTCQACQSWFGLNAYMDTAGRCRNCTQPRCKQCAADGSCAVCSEGYPHAGRCGRCTDPNCAYCPEDPARCEGCRGGGDMGDPGFFMDQQGLCHKCPWKGCVACNPDGSCAMCHSGYFKRQRWGVAAGGCSPCAKGQSCVRCQIEYEYLCSACTRRLGELECTACGGWAQGATSLLGFEFDKKCRLVRGPEPGR